MHGRNQILKKDIKKGFGWVLFSIFVCTLIAISAKETGILLPIFLILIEFLFYRDLSSVRVHKIIRLLLTIPLVCFFIYILLNLETLQAGFFHSGIHALAASFD